MSIGAVPACARRIRRPDFAAEAARDIVPTAVGAVLADEGDDVWMRSYQTISTWDIAGHGAPRPVVGHGTPLPPAPGHGPGGKGGKGGGNDGKGKDGKGSGNDGKGNDG